MAPSSGSHYISFYIVLIQDLLYSSVIYLHVIDPYSIAKDILEWLVLYIY